MYCKEKPVFEKSIHLEGVAILINFFAKKNKHKINQLTCLFTTKFLTPSMTKEDPCETSLENIDTVLVPAPSY